jgi:hypothetical protein
MPKFRRAITRERFLFVSSYDPTIDWSKSGCTPAEYRKDPDANRSKLVHTEDPIAIWLRLPSDKAKMAALGQAGVTIDVPEENQVDVRFSRHSDLTEESSAMLSNLSMMEALGRLCICGVDNLDDAPPVEQQRQKMGHGLEQLTPEMCELLGDDVLFEVGAYLFRSMDDAKLDDAKKKPSEHSASGTRPSENTDTQTTAQSAQQTTTSPDGGDVVAPQSQTSTPESD